MSGAAALLFVVPVVLLIAGAATVWLGVREGRRRTAGPVGQIGQVGQIGRIGPAAVVAVVARVVAGLGTIGFAVLALSVLWSEQQYGIVILPIAALVGAALWNGVLLSVAAIATAVARRPGPQPARDR